MDDQTALSGPYVPANPALRRRPSLLDEAVAKYNIPQWPYEAVFDRIIVFSVPEEKTRRETAIAGGRIIAPEMTKNKEESMSPRAIIVSAGLSATDYLADHGMGLGHLVWVARLAPWRHEVERSQDGKDITFMFLRASDVVGSETLLDDIRTGKVEVSWDDKHRCHKYATAPDHGGARRDPPTFTA